MPFDERTDWVDTPSPPAPPGSTPVHAADIKRWERGIAEAHEGLVGKLSKADADATYGPKAGTISANVFGARPNASWQTNRDAFQAAQDVASIIGGTVVAEPGIYLVKGLVQDSHVTFHLDGVTLKNPDGLAPDVITSRQRSTTGSIDAGSRTLTVASADKIEVGTVVGIQVGSGSHPTQRTTLTGAVDATQTTGFTLTQTGSSWPNSGYMQVEDEVIRYTGISSGALTGVQRGQFGTVAAPHAAGAAIGFAVRHYGEVVEVNGTTLTIDSPCPRKVVNAEVSFGIVAPGIVGGTIDGNSVPGGSPSSVYEMSWTLTSYGIADRTRFVNADHGGVILSRGTRRCTLIAPSFHDCGVITGEDTGKGAGIWLYAGARDNHIIAPNFSGDFWCAVYLDDRTSVASEWDAQPLFNRTDHVSARTPRRGYAPLLSIAGGSFNTFSGGRVSEGAVGFKVEEGGQGITPDGTFPKAEGNIASGIVFDTITPWLLNASGNLVENCVITSRALNSGQNSGNSQILNCSPSPGAARTTGELSPIGNGTAGAPALRFASHPNTGIYNFGLTGALGFSALGKHTMAMYASELRLADSTRIATGTDLGTKFPFQAHQKVGFWGATPVAQPAAIADTTGADVTALEAEVNKLKALLRQVGLMAS
jgi:hypothetical protein